MTTIDSLSPEQILKSMRGASAIIWSYSASLQELTLRLERPRLKGNLRVILNACEWIQGPTDWLDADLEYHPPGPNGLVRIEDRQSGLVVKCRLIRFEQDVEPVFSPTDPA